MGLFTVHNQGGGSHIFSKHNLGGVYISPLTQKCHVYFCTTKGGGDPKHKSMYKCAYMYVHLSLSPPPPPPPGQYDIQ